VLRRIADIARGKAQLIAGVNSARPAETLELASEAKTLGYDALMLAAPYYSLPTTEELAGHFRRIVREVGLPIILYNFPARTGVDMDATFLEAVADLPEICAVKESSGSMARTLDHVVHRSGQLELICGADDQALDFFLWGARSWIAGAANILPAEHVELYRACVQGQDFLRGREIMRRMLPLFLLMEGGGKYLQYVKYGAERLGLPIGSVRPPLGPLSDPERARFGAAFDTARGLVVNAKAA
jgi:4-hydroxy-tetrahydrodipicolinate synthase